MNDLISVIVPVYNVEKYLERCVESILGQTHKELEIILVDDGSTDNSGILCDTISKTDKRIVVIHKQNGGLSSARNAGLDICHGRYINFVDSDDFIEKEMLEELLKANKLNDTLIACGGRYDSFDDKEKRVVGLCPTKKEIIDSREGIKKILTFDNLDSASCDKLFHKSIWEELRFPIGKISEDVAVMYLAFDKARRISMVPTPFYNYYHRVGSITTSNFSEKKFDVIDNVNSIEKFIVANYYDLYDDFMYFKAVEYHHIIGCLLKSNETGYKDTEKHLITALGKCKKVFKRIKWKARITYYIYSSIALYRLYKFLYRTLH